MRNLRGAAYGASVSFFRTASIQPTHDTAEIGSSKVSLASVMKAYEPSFVALQSRN